MEEVRREGKDKLAGFCVGFVLVAMVQFPIRLALTYGAEIGVGGWENNERETDCRIPRT